MLAVAFVLALAGTGTVVGSAHAQPPSPGLPFEVQSLDGSGNNVANPTWGLAGNDYSRVTDTATRTGSASRWPGRTPAT
jgi:hypothetical protein